MIAASAEYAPPAKGLLDVVPVHFARGKSGGVEIRLGKRLCMDAPGKNARRLVGRLDKPDRVCPAGVSRRGAADGAAANQGARPSIRAQRLANALALDMLLQSGRYSSMSELARKLGITLRILQHHLPLLELSPAEMEEILLGMVLPGRLDPRSPLSAGRGFRFALSNEPKKGRKEGRVPAGRLPRLAVCFADSYLPAFSSAARRISMALS